jgi:DNA-directed RNA polymerase sigma subunit (sigma70/sigma32)
METNLSQNTIENLFSTVLTSLSEKERTVIERRIGLN